MRWWILSLLMGAMGWGMACAQPRTVVLRTNLPEAFVYADSVLLGTADRGRFAIPPGTGVLRLVPPAVDAWSIPPVSRSLAGLPAADSLVLTLRFPYRYRIETIPFGASVTLHRPDGTRIDLGVTPLTHASAEPLEGVLVVERLGYLPERIEPGRDLWNRAVLTLTPALRTTAPQAEVTWSPPRRPRRWIDYAAVGLAVSAGALSVYYKFKADDLYDAYLRTGDPALRPRVTAYDDRALVALGVMQVGVGVLAVRLALRR